MKTKLIGCASSMNEVQWEGPPQGTACEFLNYSYHANPVKLRQKLQEIIDESQEYDLIILTYSRCSNALLGLVSPQVPMLLPGTHDCIGLLLGSNEKHLSMVRDNVGTYYFSQGWLDYGRTPYDEYLEYVDKYGAERARHFIEALYGRYKKAVFIKTKGIKDIEGYRRKVDEIAAFFGWQVEEIEGDPALLEALIRGRHSPGTIYVEPGQEITEELLKGSKNP